MGATVRESGLSQRQKDEQWNLTLKQKETAWANRPGAEGDRERLLGAQKTQKDFEDIQKKHAEELVAALKLQKQFAATAQGKNGTLITNPSANGAAIAPPPGQKTLLGQ